MAATARLRKTTPRSAPSTGARSEGGSGIDVRVLPVTIKAAQ
jgi:hypothetical protein